MTKRIINSALSSVILILLLGACKYDPNKKELNVFCAASLTEIVSALADSFMLTQNTHVICNFASSGTLARQIELGAPSQIFISANKKWMDRILSTNISDSAFLLAGNSLVLITNINSAISAIDLNVLRSVKCAIGDPEYVPVGAYAKELLENLNLWNPETYLMAKDAKSTLRLVEMDEADVGIVYKTDVLQSNKVRILNEFPDSLHRPVNYFVCRTGDNNAEAARAFIRFITSEKGKAIFSSYGFKTIN